MEIAGRKVQHLEALQPVRALAEHKVPAVDVGEVEPDAGALGHDLRP